MKEPLQITVRPMSSDDDAGEVYAQISDRRDQASVDDWFSGLVGEGAAPTTNAQGGATGAADAAQGELPAGGAPAAPAPALPGAGGALAPQDAAAAAPVPPVDEQGDAGWTPEDIGSALLAVGSDVAGGLVEAPRQAMGGVISALDEAAGFMDDILPLGGVQLFNEAGDLDVSWQSSAEMDAQGGDAIFQAIMPDDPDTVTGGFVRSTTQFLTGFIPALKVVKGAKALQAGGKATQAAVQGLTAGAIADAVVFDPYEDRLSTFLNEIPALEAVVPDYLADTDPANQSAWEGRLKNAIEGAGLGLATDMLTRSFRYYKAQRAAKAQGAAAADPVGAQQAAARDALREASVDELQNEISDEALAPLGDPRGPLLIEAGPEETITDATKRMLAATARAELAANNQDALGKVTAILDRFGKRAGAVEGRDPLDDMLDELRSGAVSAAKLPKRPIAAIVRGMGGIDPTSSLAGDLRSRGITPKSFPGLFSKKPRVTKTAQGDIVVQPRTALDNIPVAEHPIFLERGLDDGAGYVPEQAWIDGLEAELKGEPWRLAEEQAAFDDVIGPLDDLDEQLSRLGIDYENLGNESVKARLKEIADEEALFARGDDVPTAYDDIDGGADAPAAPFDGGPLPVAPGGKVYVNHARIQSADDVKAIIQQMADMDEDAIKAKTRGVVSNAQTIRESSQEYRDLNDLIGRAPGPMTAAQAVAARRLLTSSGEQIVQLAKRAQAPDASKADLYNFRRAMSVHYAIQSEVIAARTETARALQSWAIPAGATKARTEAISEMIAMQGGAGDMQALAKAVAQVADNPTALNAMAQELGKGRFGKALYQVWINGLLSSPKTHAVNILSNAMVAAYSIPERYMSAAISNVFYGGEIATGEGAAQAYGAVKGIRDGVRLVAHGVNAEGMSELSDVFDAFVKTGEVHGQAISAEAFGLDSAGSLGRGIDMMGKFINLPGSALAAEDKFFKSIGYRMELNALAYRTAMSEGLTGREAAARVVDILNNPPANLKAEAIDVAHYNTFTNPLGKLGQSVQSLAGRVPFARVVVPFIRTPTNIMKFVFARTPLAYMSTKIRADIAAGGSRAASAHARVALGSMIMLTAADMTLEGTIEGAGPKEPNLRRVWLNAGHMPYSIKVGDRRYAFNRLDPIGMMMGLAADIAELSTNANGEETEMLATAGVMALANNLASKTYMNGIFDFVAAFDATNPTSNPGRYIENFAGSLMPYSSFLRNTAQAADPMLRDARSTAFGEDGKEDPVATWLENTQNRIRKGIPGLSDELPPMRDLWGEDISTASGLGWAIDYVSPLASKADNPDAVESVILDNQISVPSAPRIINGVRLSGQEYADFVREAGRPAKAYLDQLVASEGFKRLSNGPDGMKAEIIKDVMNNFRDRAKAVMLQRYPQLRERAFVREKERTRLLTGQQ